MLFAFFKHCFWTYTCKNWLIKRVSYLFVCLFVIWENKIFISIIHDLLFFLFTNHARDPFYLYYPHQRLPSSYSLNKWTHVSAKGANYNFVANQRVADNYFQQDYNVDRGREQLPFLDEQNVNGSLFHRKMIYKLSLEIIYNIHFMTFNNSHYQKKVLLVLPWYPTSGQFHIPGRQNIFTCIYTVHFTILQKIKQKIKNNKIKKKELKKNFFCNYATILFQN